MLLPFVQEKVYWLVIVQVIVQMKEALEHLRYAFEFLSLVRVRHQAREVEASNAPSNYIEPEQFSASERQHLKEAFQVISNAQKFLRFRYPAQPASRPR